MALEMIIQEEGWDRLIREKLFRATTGETEDLDTEMAVATEKGNNKLAPLPRLTRSISSTPLGRTCRKVPATVNNDRSAH